MKKLTKVLSLVLVIAMVVSLCVVGASAKTFSDTDKVTETYKEAVDVLSDLGIVDGMNATTFAPNGNFTRAQACAIIARMTVGADAAKTISASTKTFSDVATSHWAYNYIEYCANAGYVGGVGNGKFSPDSTLTGYQFALMVMRVLGFDTADCTGANWAINTAKLYYAKDFSAVAITNSVITREAAVQIAYDGLFFSTNATTGYAVKYTEAGETSVIGYYNTYSEAQNAVAMFTALSSKKGTYSADTTATNIVNGTTLAKTVFGVSKNTSKVKADDFGRPANVYTTDTKAEATAYGWDTDAYTSAAKLYIATPVLTYTAAVTGGKLYTDLGKTTPTTLSVYVNGYSTAAYTAGVKAAIKSGNTNSFGGNGTVIEVYKTATGTYTMVGVSTMPGVITKHVAAVKDSNGDIATKEYVQVTYDGGTANFNTTDFTDKDVTNGTVVIATYTYNGSDYTVQSLKAATAVSVVPTSCNDKTTVGVNKAFFTADGKTYQYNENAATFVSSTDVTNKTTKTVYVDGNGYVVAVADPTSATANVAVVIGSMTSTTLEGVTYTARLLMPDGKTADVTTTVPATNDSLVTYTINAKGKYVLANINTIATPVKAATITQGSVKFTAAGSADNMANSKTVFFVQTSDASGNPVYNAYVGVSAVPSLTATNSVVYKASGDYATAVYVTGATLNSSSTISTDTIYVTTKGAYLTYATTGNYYTYNAVVNGKITTLKAADGVFDADGFYGDTVVNAYGVITAKSALTGTKVAVVNTPAVGTAAASSGVVTFNTAATKAYMTYTDATTVYTVSSTGVITASSVAAIAADADDTVCYYTTNGVLTSAVITVVG